MLMLPIGPLPPLRLPQFLGPHPAPKLALLPVCPPLTLKALLPGEHELQAAEPGSMSALPPYPDAVFGGKPRPVKIEALTDEPLSTGGKHG